MTFHRNALLASAIGLVLAVGFAPLDAAAKDHDKDKDKQDKHQTHGQSDQHRNDGRGEGDRGHDNRGNDNRGNDNRGHDSSAWDNRAHDNRPPVYRPQEHRNDDHRNDDRRYDARRYEPSHDDRQRMIAMQQRRDAEYRQHIAQMRAADARRDSAINAQRRAQQARYQQWYWQQQQAQAARWTPRNYSNDPYYSTAPTYRYIRDGRTYQVNQYAANALQQAVRNGYEMGARAGDADRADRWQNDWRNNVAYQDANYGYNGAYVDQSDYNYYFRQGFQRGYGDGYGNNWQNGTQVGNDSGNILASVLNAILGLQSYN